MSRKRTMQECSEELVVYVCRQAEEVNARDCEGSLCEHVSRKRCSQGGLEAAVCESMWQE
jgi:hypothetical protein